MDNKFEILREHPPTSRSITLRPYFFPSGSKEGGRDGIIVKFKCAKSGQSWIGVFAFGELGGLRDSKVLEGPGENRISVLSAGNGYVVDLANPKKVCEVVSYPAIDMFLVPESDLVVFHDYTEMIAYNADGVAWRTKRISWDGIHVLKVTEESIFGTAWNAPTSTDIQFRVDVTNGDSFER